MCEFVSWYTAASRIHFLTDADMPRVRELGITLEDVVGHGAIYAVRGWSVDNKPSGTEHECTDFSTPSKFPPEIVAAIKEGRMTYGPPCDGLLTQAANAQWQAADAQWQVAYDQWKAADAQRKAANAQRRAADAQWQAAYDQRQVADAQWQVAYDQWKAADAQWQVADAQWRTADAQWRAAYQRAFWSLFAIPANRAQAWR